MLGKSIVVSILSWTLIDATIYQSKGLLDKKLSSNVQLEKMNHKNKISIVSLINANVIPTTKEMQFKTLKNSKDTSNKMHLDLNTIFKKSEENVDLSLTTEDTQFLNSDKLKSAGNRLDLNKMFPEANTNYTTSDAVIDTYMEEINMTDVIKNISKRSTSAQNCFLSERSTCPWYYDNNGNAHCSQSIPVGCDPGHCLLRCHLLYSNNRSIACVSTRPCFIQAGGQATSSCI